MGMKKHNLSRIRHYFSFENISPRELDYRGKSIMLFLFSIFGIILFLAFAILFALRGDTGQVIINTNVAIVLLILTGLARRSFLRKLKFNIGVFMIIMATSYLFLTADEEISRILWMMILPLPIYFLLHRKLAIWSNLVLLAFITAFFFIPGLPGSDSYGLDLLYRIRYILTFLMISVLCLIFESIRVEMFHRLMDNQQLIEKRNADLGRANNHVKLLHREMHHRIKNNLAIITSILDFETEDIVDPDARRAIDAIMSKIFSVGLVHERLYEKAEQGDIDLGVYLDELARTVVESHRSIPIDLETSLSSFQLDSSRTVLVGLIVSELLINSLKYAFPGREAGGISLSCETTGQEISLRLSDDGKPSTASVKTGHEEGIGMQLVRGMVDQLKGTLELSTGSGTAYIIRFPV
jgi:two-component sensor histidine kinase